jgi:hypothetical protein
MTAQADIIANVGYYVTVRNGSRTGGLLGPYDTQAEALENVERGRKLALASDNETRSWFYEYGTTKLTTRGRLPKSVFGV